MPTRLVVVATHPTDHLAPYLRALTGRPEIDLHVFYAYRPGSEAAGKSGEAAHDIAAAPLLEGYSWSDLENVRVDEKEPDGYRGLSVKKIHKQLESEKPDAVMATGWYSRILSQAAKGARRLKVPAFLRGKWNDLQTRGFNGHRRFRSLVKPFSGFLAVGRANRRLYEQSGIADSEIFDVPYGIDTARYVAKATELRPHRAEYRDSWQVDGEDFCVLSVGRIDETRRPFDLLEAMEVGRKDRRELRLLMVGAGPLEAAVRERARERRLPVSFAGHLLPDELARAYAAADALALASDAREAWGLVVNEAMASGIPAVVSDQVGCREDLVVDGETGFSFRTGDARGLAACLATLAADPIRSAAMGEAARDRVVAEYSIDRAVDGTLAALEASNLS
jgi:glycosyltransferase involved in cell wall biosynthesis